MGFCSLMSAEHLSSSFRHMLGLHAAPRTRCLLVVKPTTPSPVRENSLSWRHWQPLLSANSAKELLPPLCQISCSTWHSWIRQATARAWESQLGMAWWTTLSGASPQKSVPLSTTAGAWSSSGPGCGILQIFLVGGKRYWRKVDLHSLSFDKIHFFQFQNDILSLALCFPASPQKNQDVAVYFYVSYHCPAPQHAGCQWAGCQQLACRRRWKPTSWLSAAAFQHAGCQLTGKQLACLPAYWLPVAAKQ